MKHLTTIGLAVGMAVTGSVSYAQDTQLRVATATSTGTFYQNGIAMETLFRNEAPEIMIYPQATGGSADNTRLARQGDVELFFGQNSTVIPAYEGTGQFEGDANTSFSAVAAIWPSVVHVIVAENSGIETVAGFEGRSVQIGPVGSGIERFTQQPIEAAGLTFDDVDGQRLGVAESVEMMQNGQLDAMIHAAIVPDANAANLMASGAAKILPFDGDIAEALMEEHSYYDVATIPAESYENQPNEVPTVASYSVLYARNDVPEDAIYGVLSTMMENQAMLSEQHASYSTMSPENGLRGLGPVALHPGAERFYREAGLLD